jgi:hypothetical protein
MVRQGLLGARTTLSSRIYVRGVGNSARRPGHWSVKSRIRGVCNELNLLESLMHPEIGRSLGGGVASALWPRAKHSAKRLTNVRS